MPFNGTGVFTRIYSWVIDAANGVVVDATRTDTDSNDIADGLSNCITRDGQSPPSAPIPWGGQKITGLGTGTLVGDAVNYGQVFNSPTFVTPSATTTPTTADNPLRLATVGTVSAAAFSAALPAQSLGVLYSNGTTASFTQTTTGFALNAVKGADIPSAATINLTTATGEFVHVTGTTTITAITIPVGAHRVVIFDGILTLTHSASLLLPGNANITTAANDRMTVRGDTAGAIVISYVRANGTSVIGQPYFKAIDRKANTTPGGSSVAATITQTRTLNIVEVSQIDGALLSSNIVTLPAGTYDFRGRAPASGQSAHKAFLYNVTDASYVGIGSNAGGTATSGASTDSFFSGRITITSQKDFTVRHYTSTALATIGLGIAATTGQQEIYTELEFWKIA